MSTFIVSQPYKERGDNASTLYDIQWLPQPGWNIVEEYTNEDEAALHLGHILQKNTATAVATNEAYELALRALETHAKK